MGRKLLKHKHREVWGAILLGLGVAVFIAGVGAAMIAAVWNATRDY